MERIFLSIYSGIWGNTFVRNWIFSLQGAAMSSIPFRDSGDSVIFFPFICSKLLAMEVIWWAIRAERSVTLARIATCAASSTEISRLVRMRIADMI